MDQIPPEKLTQMSKETQGPTSIAVCVAFTVLALISVVLRFISRINFVKRLGVEDYFIAVSMVR